MLWDATTPPPRMQRRRRCRRDGRHRRDATAAAATTTPTPWKPTSSMQTHARPADTPTPVLFYLPVYLPPFNVGPPFRLTTTPLRQTHPNPSSSTPALPPWRCIPLRSTAVVPRASLSATCECTASCHCILWRMSHHSLYFARSASDHPLPFRRATAPSNLTPKAPSSCPAPLLPLTLFSRYSIAIYPR